MTDPELLAWYVADQNPERGAQVVSVEVPAADLERYRVKNQPEAVRRYSRDPENEFYLPAELARQAAPLPTIDFAEVSPQRQQFDQAWHPEAAKKARLDRRETMRRVVGAMTREYALLPHGGEYSDIRQRMTFLSRGSGVAEMAAKLKIAEYNDKLSEPEQRELDWAAYVRDLAEDWETYRQAVQEEDPELSPEAVTEEAARRWTPPNLIGEDGEPVKVWTPQIVAKEQAALAQQPAKIQAALQARKEIVAQVGQELLDWMERATGRRKEFTREEYVHHQILQYVLDPDGPEYARVVGSGAKRVRALARGFMRQRHGTTLAHNSSLMASDLEWMQQAIYDTMMWKAVALARERYDVTGELKRIASARNREALLEHFGEKARELALQGKAVEPERLMRSELNAGLAQAFNYFGYLAEAGRLPDAQGRFADLVEELQNGYAASKAARAYALANDQPLADTGRDTEYSGQLFQYAQWLLSEAKRSPEPVAGSGAAAQLFKATAARERRIREILGKEHLTPDDVLKTDPQFKGYRWWQPDPGRTVFRTATLPDRIASQILQGLAKELEIDAEDLGSVQALGGPKLRLALPTHLADSLDGLDKLVSRDHEDLYLAGLQALKKVQVFNPAHSVEFAMRKTLTDAQAMGMGDVQALKEWPGALMEVARTLAGQRPESGGDLQKFMLRGGLHMNILLGREMRSREGVDFLRGLSTTERVKEAFGPGRRLETARKLITLFGPEAVQLIDGSARYATYKAYLQILKENHGVPHHYAFSLPDEVLALWGHGRDLAEQQESMYHDRAWKLSNDLMVAYDEVPPGIKGMADRALGLFSLYLRWEQGNGRRWARRLTEPLWSADKDIQIFEKLAKQAHDERAAMLTGGEGGKPPPPIPPKRGGGGPGEPPEPPDRGLFPRVPLSRSPRVLAKVGAVAAWGYASTIAAKLVSRYLQADLERDLPPEVRERAPWILGTDPATGKTMVYERLNSMQETLRPLGLDNAWEWRGHLTPAQFALLHGRDLGAAMWNLLGPTAGMIEGAVGRRLDQNLNLREIKDQRRYIMDQLGLGVSWRYLEDMATRSQHREPFRILGVREYDRLESNYYEIRDKVQQQTGASSSEKSGALYQAHQAAREGDLAGAAQFMIQYHHLGGDERGQRASLARLDPLFGLNPAEARAFALKLDAGDQARLKGALLYWKSFVDPLDRGARPLPERVMALPIDRFVERLRGDLEGRIKGMSAIERAVRQHPEARAQFRADERAKERAKEGRAPVGAK